MMVWRLLVLAVLLSCVELQLPHRGPYCFDCDDMTSPDMCANASECDQGQVCMLTEKTSLGLDGQPTYKTSCASPMDCRAGEQVSLIFGKKRTTRCHTCCQDDFCNDKCDYEQVTTPASPPLTSRNTSSSNGTLAILVPTRPHTTLKQNLLTSSTTGTPVILIPTKPLPTNTQQTTHITIPQHYVTYTSSTTSQNVTIQRFRERCERNRYQYDEGSNLCFAPHADHATWDLANHRCRNEHGMLAVIDTPEKWLVLRQVIMVHYRHNVYIGGRGHGKHSHDYFWTNGARFNFTAWAQGQPDSSHEDCVCVDHRDHHWHDSPCEQQLHFVCTMELQD